MRLPTGRLHLSDVLRTRGEKRTRPAPHGGKAPFRPPSRARAAESTPRAARRRSALGGPSSARPVPAQKHPRLALKVSACVPSPLPTALLLRSLATPEGPEGLPLPATPEEEELKCARRPEHLARTFPLCRFMPLPLRLGQSPVPAFISLRGVFTYAPPFWSPEAPSHAHLAPTPVLLMPAVPALVPGLPSTLQT